MTFLRYFKISQCSVLLGLADLIQNNNNNHQGCNFALKSVWGGHKIGGNVFFQLTLKNMSILNEKMNKSHVKRFFSFEVHYK